MSKGDSHIFTGTSGEGRQLIDEVIVSGWKISPEKVVGITRDPNDKIIWLETGNESSGLEHIIIEHKSDFNDIGITQDVISNFVLEAVHQGKIIGTQGKGKNPRAIYEVEYNGNMYKIAIQVGSNGYIVGANPKSIKRRNK